MSDVERCDWVYTWVDGSDARWRETKARHAREAGEAIDDRDIRYEDSGELMFALRSLERYCSFVGRVFLVTDSHVPKWLDLSHPGLTVVDHRDLFEDPSVLPTYNSMAIETQLSRIKGVSRRFVYCNDDVILTRPTRYEDFFTGDSLVVYPCAVPGALESPKDVAATDGTWEAAMCNANRLLDEIEVSPRFVLEGTPAAYDVELFEEMRARFAEAFRHTARQRFRTSDQILVNNFMFPYFAALKGRLLCQAAPRAITVYDRGHAYFVTRDGVERTTEEMLRFIEERSVQFLCINGVRTPARLTELMGQLFPEPSSFERRVPSDG
jgi:hypothetical protein